MNKWVVEMSVGTCVSMDDVEANSYEEAIAEAKRRFFEDEYEYLDGGFEIDQINFVMERK
jgi:hypothetical protein